MFSRRPVLLVLFLAQALFAHADYRCEQALTRNHFTLLNATGKSYTNHRSASDYFNLLGGWFVHDLRSLPTDSHWLDAGAGQAIAMDGFATGTYLVENLGYVQVQSRGLTALGVKLEWSPHVQRLSTAPGRQFRYLSGKYLEDYSFDEIGACDLITDVYGPFSYSARPDLVLRKYLEILKIGGKAYIHLNLRQLTINNNWSGLGKYLGDIKGIRIDWVDHATIRIEKTSWTNWWDVPELHLEYFQDGTPPARRYWR